MDLSAKISDHAVLSHLRSAVSNSTDAIDGARKIAFNATNRRINFLKSSEIGVTTWMHNWHKRCWRETARIISQARVSCIFSPLAEVTRSERMPLA